MVGILGQCPFYDIQEHLLVGESVSCRLYIEKLETCLQYTEDCTRSLMLTDCIYLKKMESRFDSY